MKVIAMSMTKRDLVVKIAEKTGLIQQDAAIVIQKLLDSPAAETSHVQLDRECR
jgi:nucleoid DNA-binding protein